MAPAPTTCIVPGCSSMATKGCKANNVKFHSVSGVRNSHVIGHERIKTWFAACKRLDLLDPLINLRTKYICSLHFEERMYTGGRLKLTAYPTLRLPTNFISSTIDAPSTSKDDYLTDIAEHENDIAETTKDDPGHVETIIKHEPLEPSDMVIEEEQIIFHHRAKGGRVAESFREHFRNVQILKVESTGEEADSKIDLTLDDDVPLNAHTIKVEPIPVDADGQLDSTIDDDGMANLHVTKVEPMYTDDQVEDCHSFISSVVTNNEIKEEIEDTESECKNELLKEANLHSEVASNQVKEEGAESLNVNNIKEEKNAKIDMHIEIPSKKKLKTLLRYTKMNVNKTKNKKNEALKRFLLGCDKYLSLKLSSIVTAHLNSKGEEFTNDYKLFCLNLYVSDPTTYIVLSQVLCLPSQNELIKSHIPIPCKTNKQMLEILAAVGNKMSETDRECVLSIGEIKLKRSIFYDAKADRMFGLHEIDGKQKPCGACFAYTVMLQGVRSDWKLLVGFSLTLLNKMNSDLLTWLADTMSQLFHLGFQIRAVNCPVTPMFIQFASLLGVGVVQDIRKVTYFEVEGKKVYFIFDISSILKKARNALCNQMFTMNEKRASWNCLRQLYQLDHKRVKRYAPRLTQLHMQPKKHVLNKLRYASEVMDSSVAGAMNIYAAKKQLKPCFGTIQFIHMISRVYKVLNSDKPIKYTGEEKRLFSQMRNLLNSIVVYDEKTVRQVEHHNLFIPSLLTTMDSMCQLSEDLNLDVKRQKLTSSCRLGLQSFYNVIRKLSGHSRRVTCVEYLRGFRRCFLFHALTLAEKNDTCCSWNNTDFLEKYENYVQKNKIFEVPKRKQRSASVLAALQHVPDETRFIHFCSYLMQKCVEKHNCPILSKYVSSPVVPLKSGKCEIAGLKVPPDHFLIYCDNLENYLQYSLKNCLGDNVNKVLVKRCSTNLYFDKPCRCFPVDYLIKMFVMLRMRYNNKMHQKKWRDENNKTVNYELIRM